MAHRSLLVLIVLLAGAIAHAAPARYEAMTYEAPKGWKVTSDAKGVQMQSVDVKANTFALIAIAPSIPSQGGLDADFTAAWTANIAPMFKVSGAPTIAPGDTENGWASKAGTAQGEASGLPVAIVLVTLSGHGRAMNVVIVMNHDKYQAPMQAFLESVKMAVPTTPAPKPATTAPATPPSAPAAPATPASSTPSTKNGAGSTSTTFDDGWTSTIEENWVRVTRPGMTVLLHYGVALDDRTRQDPTDAFWRMLVVPRYTSVRNVTGTAYSELNFPYYERAADVTDRDGKSAYVVMRLSIAGGVASTFEVIAPSRDAYMKQFPDRAQIVALQGANRFSVGADVAGTWSSSTGASVDMYYVATGNYAGTNAAAIANRFELGKGGVYSSEHKGATGRVGSMDTFQVRYTGTWSVTSPWEITVKRTDKVTTVYAASYQAVRGGRVLRLQDKQYTGMQYALVREK